MIKYAWVRAALVDGKPIIEGDHVCRLGNRAERADGSCTGDVGAEWSWNGETLTVANDRFGYYPVFYYQRDDEIGVSNSAIKLIAEGGPGELDDEAVGTFLRLGFYLRERTPFKHIFVLPPAGRLVWRAGRVTVAGGTVLTKPQRLTREQAVEGYIELVRQAVRRRPPNNTRFAVPLSGGRDSRQILLELHRQGHRPTQCVTFDPDPRQPAPDMKVASQIAVSIGVEHIVVGPVATWLAYVLRKNVLASFCSSEHTWIMPAADYLRRNHAEWYDGMGVGIFSRGDLIKRDCAGMLEKGDFLGCAKYAFGKTIRLPEEGITLFQECIALPPVSMEHSLAVTAEELRHHATAANPLASFAFYNWDRRGISLGPTGPGMPFGKYVHTPLMDDDLFDFVASFETELVLECEPQTEAIRRAFPAHSQFPFDKDIPNKHHHKPVVSGYRNMAATQAFLLQSGWSYSRAAQRVMVNARLRASRRQILSFLVYMSQLRSCTSAAGATRLLSLLSE